MSGVAIGHCIAECSLNFEDRAHTINRSKAGVAYGASHLTCAADLLPPKDALLPMGDVRDYSLFCTVDSDLPGKGLPVRNVEDTTFIDKQSHTALSLRCPRQ